MWDYYKNITLFKWRLYSFQAAAATFGEVSCGLDTHPQRVG